MKVSMVKCLLAEIQLIGSGCEPSAMLYPQGTNEEQDIGSRRGMAEIWDGEPFLKFQAGSISLHDQIIYKGRA